MYKTWTGSGRQIDVLARDLEAHLNEFADEVISVAYAVTEDHHVLAVYKPVEFSSEAGEEVAVSEAELIIEAIQN